MGGAIMAPISVRATIVRKCPRWKGVSLTPRMSFRCSLRVTSAARTSRLELIPAAIEDMV